MSSLHESKAFGVGYSSRNKNFSKSWFSNIRRLAEDYNKPLQVTIVDIPYAYNDASLQQLSTPTAGMLEKNIKIGDEREAMVYRVFAQSDPEFLRIQRWPDFDSRQNVKSFRKELKSAFETSPLFRSEILGYVSEWGGINSQDAQELSASFIIEELAVFCWIYYVQEVSVDLYPGKMFPFFWDLETGYWKRDLPNLSSVANGKEMVFISTMSDVS